MTGTQKYYPYGRTRVEGNLPTDKLFTGHQQEGNLYFMQARFYDPTLGRFLSADTIVPDPDNPQALNRYSYVLGNPLRYADPSGYGPCATIGGVQVCGLPDCGCNPGGIATEPVTEFGPNDPLNAVGLADPLNCLLVDCSPTVLEDAHAWVLRTYEAAEYCISLPFCEINMLLWHEHQRVILMAKYGGGRGPKIDRIMPEEYPIMEDYFLSLTERTGGAGWVPRTMRMVRVLGLTAGMSQASLEGTLKQHNYTSGPGETPGTKVWKSPDGKLEVRITPRRGSGKLQWRLQYVPEKSYLTITGRPPGSVSRATYREVTHFLFPPGGP